MTNDNHALSQLAIEAALVRPDAESVADRTANMICTGAAVGETLRQHAAAIREKSDDLARHAECLADGIQARLEIFARLVEQHAEFCSETHSKVAGLVEQLGSFDQPQEPPAADRANGNGAAHA